MPDLEPMVQWAAYLSFCLSDDIASIDCNSHWSIVVLAGFVLALLIFIFAGHRFFKVHREIRRGRFILGARDIAAAEKLIDEHAQTGGGRFVLELAEKYRKAFERSDLVGWRIHGDR